MSLTSRAEGFVSPAFEPVRHAFMENFERRHELGGACSVYRDGNTIVDLWGGTRNDATGEPWERDTMVIVYSASKGLAAMTLAIAHHEDGSTTKNASAHTGRSSRNSGRRG